MGFFMRPATPEDVDELVELEAQLFENSFNERTLREEIKLGPCWIATCIERRWPIAGYLLSRVDGDLLDITRIGVAKSEQRKGIAANLLDVATYRSSKIMLTVRKANKIAIRLYKSKGFVVVGHIQQPASWVMVRPATSEPM